MTSQAKTSVFLAMRTASLVGVILIGLASVGCQARAVSKPVGDYQPVSSTIGLSRDWAKSPELVYKRRGAPDFSAYSRFIVGPVVIDYRDPDMQELSQESVQKIQDRLIAAVTDELEEGGYAVGTRAGPGTMRMSFVVSGFSASEAGGAVNAAAMAAGSVVGIPMLVTLGVGEVTVEGVFSDAFARRTDAVVIDRSVGARLFNGNPLSTWADVDAAFQKWAQGIRASIDEDHGT